MTDPRVARTREHVLATAADLLADEGREGFSIDALARRSGVARTTIYRHWPDTDVLLFDTFNALADSKKVDADTGSVRNDLVAIYQGLGAGFADSCLGRCLPVLIDMTRRDPNLEDLHRAFIAERRAPSRRAVERGIERGELPDDLDVDAFIDRVAGPVFYRTLVTRTPMSAREIERLVDDVLSRQWPSRPARSRPATNRRAAS